MLKWILLTILTICFLLSVLVTFFITRQTLWIQHVQQFQEKSEITSTIFDVALKRLESIVNFGAEYGNDFTFTESNITQFIKLSGLDETIELEYTDQLLVFYNITQEQRPSYEEIHSPIINESFNSQPIESYYCPQTLISPSRDTFTPYQGLDVCHNISFQPILAEISKLPLDQISSTKHTIPNTNRITLDLIKRFNTGFAVLSISLEQLLEFLTTFILSDDLKFTVSIDELQVFSNCNGCTIYDNVHQTIDVYNTNYTINIHITTLPENTLFLILIGIFCFLYFVLCGLLFYYYYNIKVQQDLANYTASKMILTYINHEMRNPLNSIIGLLELSVDELESLHQYEIQSDLNTALNCCKIMNNVLVDVVDIKQLQEGTLYVSENSYPLSAILQDVNKMIMFKTNEYQNLTFSIINESTKETLFTDKNRLEQVLANFLINAFKFTNVGSVTLKVYDVNDKIRFDVIDTGIGITQVQKSRIFKPYPNITHAQVGGLGIGLYLCQLIANRLGYKIGFDSQENIGSTFWIEL